ncbi:MAG: inorganic pyrophosphatase [Acidobacteriota bacterium]
MEDFHRYRPHPWHGPDVGPDPPQRVYAYIEITPYDLVKYELDKRTGFLKVDRPQRGSSLPPTLYGFIPRTYCGPRVGDLMPEAERGDQDPLDICVLSERPINRAEVLIGARVIGGLPMVDGGEADDKIIAVVEGDPLWAEADDIDSLPATLVARLRHYFMTYKMMPGPARVEIGAAYGRRHAQRVIEAAMADYAEAFDTSSS